jgi:hypothetical protein
MSSTNQENITFGEALTIWRNNLLIQEELKKLNTAESIGLIAEFTSINDQLLKKFPIIYFYKKIIKK